MPSHAAKTPVSSATGVVLSEALNSINKTEAQVSCVLNS